MSRFNKDVMWQSKDLTAQTPKDLYQELDKIFHFTLDPCANENNELGASKFYTKKDDGLTKSWKGERAFINPPYGRKVSSWIEKAYDEVVYSGCDLAVMLLAARTDTRWFHDYCAKGEIWFLKGRLKFGNYENSAPFPSMIVIFPREFDIKGEMSKNEL